MSLQVLEWDSGEPLSDDAMARYAKKIETIDEVAEIIPGRTSGEQIALPFYETATLLVFTDPQWLPKGARLCYLDLEGDLFRLNGTSPPIHEVNAKAPIKISEDNLLIYLVFFCFFVRGEEGPFFVLENPESPILPKMPDEVDLFEHVRTPKCWGKGEDGHWRVAATVFYSNAVFAADFLVQPSGMIEMADDTPIAGDLPVKVEAPLILEGVIQA